MTSVSFASIVNRPAEYALCRQTLVEGNPGAENVQWPVIFPNERGWNGSQGLNAGIDACDGDWIVSVHQDVRFPRGWLDAFKSSVARLPESTAVVGVVGTTRGGSFRGHIVDPNGHCYWPDAEAEVLTLDECLIAIRRSSGLRFDETVPGFHCYGADLCLHARAAKLSVRTIDAPILHLSTGTMDPSYERAAKHLLDRWGSVHGWLLPTPATPITDRSRISWLRSLGGRIARRRSHDTRHRACTSTLCADVRRLEAESRAT